MWNIKKQQQQSGKPPQEDALWTQFKTRAGIFAVYIAAIIALPPLMRHVGVLEPITFSLARK